MDTIQKIVVAIISSFSFFHSSAQTVFCSNTDLDYVNYLAQTGKRGTNKVYIGIENALKIIVEGKTFNELEVYYNGNRLLKENGFFLLNPTVIDTIIYKDQIYYDEHLCRLYVDGIEKPLYFDRDTLPQPNITISQYNSHFYNSDGGLLNLHVIFPVSISESYSYKKMFYEIKSYKLTIIKNNQTVYSKIVGGSKLDDEAFDISKTLCKNDKLILDSVDVRVGNLKYIINTELQIYDSVNDKMGRCFILPKK